MNHKKIIAGMMVLAMFMTTIGCAAIFKGSKQKVALSSEPSDVQVYVNGFPRGTTPLTLKLKSKDTHTVEFKKDGYKTRTLVIDNHLGAGWIILDVLGGLIPVVVDATTGSWYMLDQRNYRAVMEADGVSLRLEPTEQVGHSDI